MRDNREERNVRAAFTDLAPETRQDERVALDVRYGQLLEGSLGELSLQDLRKIAALLKPNSPALKRGDIAIAILEGISESGSPSSLYSIFTPPREQLEHFGRDWVYRAGEILASYARTHALVSRDCSFFDIEKKQKDLWQRIQREANKPAELGETYKFQVLRDKPDRLDKPVPLAILALSEACRQIIEKGGNRSPMGACDPHSPKILLGAHNRYAIHLDSKKGIRIVDYTKAKYRNLPVGHGVFVS